MRWIPRVLGIAAVSVFLTQLASAQEQEMTLEEFVSVQTETINLRLEPNTHSEILGKLPVGGRYRVLAKTKNWVRIRHGYYGDGWLYRPLITLVADTTYVERLAAVDTGETEAMGTTGASSSPGRWIVPAIGVTLVLALMLIIAFTAGRGDEHLIHHHT